MKTLTSYDIIRMYKNGVRDFSNVSAQEQDFHGVDLSGANFTNCNFRACDFENCRLLKTNLTGANLDWVNANDANFTDAILDKASMRYSKFERAIFERAKMRGADLSFSLFMGAQFLESADKTNVIMFKTAFSSSDLEAEAATDVAAEAAKLGVSSSTKASINKSLSDTRKLIDIIGGAISGIKDAIFGHHEKGYAQQMQQSESVSYGKHETGYSAKGEYGARKKEKHGYER